MARPNNVGPSVEIRVSVLPIVREWLNELAKLGIYGKSYTEVAEHFVRQGVERHLGEAGFLREPPPKPAQLPKGSE